MVSKTLHTIEGKGTSCESIDRIRKKQKQLVAATVCVLSI